MPSSHCASSFRTNRSAARRRDVSSASILQSGRACTGRGLRPSELAQIERISQRFGACGFYFGCGLLKLVLLPCDQDDCFEIASQTYSRGTTIPWLAPVTMATDSAAWLIPASTRPSAAQLPESRQQPLRAPSASDCDPPGEGESSRPSAPPYSAVSPADHAILFSSKYQEGFVFQPAQEPSPGCTSPRAAAARLPEPCSGQLKHCERLPGQITLRHPDKPFASGCSFGACGCGLER